MEFLAKTYRQLIEVYQSMTPATRVSVVLLLVVIIFTVSLFVTYSDRSETFLFGGHQFAERDLQSMEAAFAKAGLKHWDRVGNQLRIPSRQEHSYVAALADSNALPRDFNSIFDEMISKTSPFESPKTREMRAQILKQKYLSVVISNLPGVNDATVHIDETTVGGFTPEHEKTAMVAIRGRADRRMARQMIESVRYTVASAIAGLSPQNVTVTDLVTGMAYPGNTQFSRPGEPANSYAQQKRAFETYWQSKILDALTMYPGLVVGVNVDLDPALATKADPAIHIAATGTHSTARDRGADGTINHAYPIISNHPRTVIADISTPIASSTYGQQTGRISSQRRTETDSLAPGFVSAAISFPRSYLMKIWRTNQSLTPKAATDQPTKHELQAIEGTVSSSIKQAVVNLLPPVPTSKGDTHVTVHTYDDFQTPFPAAPGTSAGPTQWLAENWQILALFGLAILGFVLIRRRIQHHYEDLTSPEAAHDSETISLSETMAKTSAQDSNEDPSFSHQLPSENDEPDFQSELTNLVKDNPDAAAEILRRWIGDVA